MSIYQQPQYVMDSIARRAGIPRPAFTGTGGGTQGTLFTEDRMLEVMNKTYLDALIPMVLSVREEHWVTFVQYATSSLNSPIVPIPTDAMGGKLRSVELWSGSQPISSPLVPTGYQVRQLPLVPRETLEWNWGYYLQGGNIVLYPVIATYNGAYLVLTYWKRPNLVDKISNVMQVSSIVGTTVNLTNPSAFTTPTTWTGGYSLDSISNNSPYDKKETISAVSRTASSITVSAPDAAKLVAGDWLATSGYSPFLNVVDELYSYFEQACAVQVQRTTKSDALGATIQEMERLQDEALHMLTPRVDADPPKVFTFRGNAEYSQ